MLQLSPLPCIRSENPQDFGSEGFVDERDIARILDCPAVARQHARPTDFVLSATEEDFAGWRISSSSPLAGMDKGAGPIPDDRKRPKPPAIHEPGIGAPADGAQRWWMAALAGMMSTLLFSMLLFSLSSRPLPGTPLANPEPPHASPETQETPPPNGREITLHQSAGGI